LYPSGSPSPLDIHLSGDLGNLFSAMAAHNPDFVKKMIQDNGDGTYTVHMHDPKGNPVDVTVNNQVPVGSNGKVVGGNNGQANWSNILLKACVKFNDLYHNLGSSAGQTGYAALKGGGDLEENVQALTGEQLGTFDSSDFSTQEKQDTLAKQMQQDINGGHVVFAADKDQTKGLYSVLEIHQNGNGRWYVDVGQGNGTITRMWMSDYVNSMHYTYISAKPVTPSGNNSLTSPESALAKLEDALQS
jgi:hypothetical protein